MLWILFGSRYFFGFAWYFRAFWVVICVFLRYFCFVLFSVLCGDQPGLPAFVYRSFVLVFSSGLLFWFALICSGVWLWLVKVFCSGGFILFFCPCCVNCSAAIFFFFCTVVCFASRQHPPGRLPPRSVARQMRCARHDCGRSFGRGIGVVGVGA